MALLGATSGAGMNNQMAKSQSMKHLAADPNQNMNPYRSSTAMTGSQNPTPYSKVSYRQKGTKADGSLIKGTTSAAFIKKTTGSVPSKYETIVYMHADSKKQGFGSNSERFQNIFSKPETEVDPGPGSYVNESYMHQMLKHSDSYSRKGFGNGFISKNDRFKQNDFSKYSFLPGPGSYQASTHQDSLMGSSITSGFTDKYKNQNLSSVFMPHTSKSLKKSTNTPGPGQYNILKNPSANQLDPLKPAAESVFKSSSKKSEYLNWNKELKNFPSPGQYEFERDNLMKKTVSTHNIMKTTSSFKLPYQCKRVKVNVYDPFQNVEALEQKVPGPGSYNIEKETIAYKNIEKLTSGMFSSMFQKPLQDVNVSPVIQKNEKGEVPGPGYYDASSFVRRDKKAVSSSMFKSDSVRDLINIQRGPGPAFYKQIPGLVENKKTFNSNPGKSWL